MSKATSCNGKIRYETRPAALKAMSALKSRKGSVASTSVYACPSCAGFHFGRDNRDQARVTARRDLTPIIKRYRQLVAEETTR